MKTKTSTMKVFNLQKNCFNIQKCHLPDCEFLKRNFNHYCIVQSKYLVKIGLNEIKNVEDLFLDESVTVISSLSNAHERTKNISDVTFEDFVILGKPITAEVVNVVVVFSDFVDVKNSNDFNLKEVVRDILKFFAFSDGCLISLQCLSQKFGINYLFIENLNKGEVYKVDSRTEIVIKECMSQLKFDQLQENGNQPRVGGCSGVYNILFETLSFSKCFRNDVKFVNKILLIGPPGCGKTTLIRNITSDTKTVLLEVQASHINVLPPVEMEKKLQSIFDEAKIYSQQKQSCVILLEDIDLMSSGRSLHAKRFNGELITLLEDVDNTPGVVVVATTNSPDDVDGQLRRAKRLEDELEIMIPTGDERVEILERIFENFGMKIEEELLIQLSNWTPGFVGGDLKLLVIETLMILKNKGLEPSLDQSQFKESFKQALTKVIPSGLKGAVGLCKGNTMSFSQIGGLDEIKKTLDLLVKQQLENPEKFRKFGIPLTKGILLYGPPGCAKTTLVKALAKECNATFLATSAADLYSPFVGDAEKKIVQLFTQARIGSPTILFFDEIDAVVGSKSGDRERGVQERILSTLLIEMDGVGLKVNTQRDNSLNILGKNKENKKNETCVVVIGATNRPQLLDDALKRPGRFDRLLYIPPPNAVERLKILQKLTEKIPLNDSVDLNDLANRTEYYSGADLKNLCQETGLYALTSSSMMAEQILPCHFEHVLREYKPSLNEKVVNFYENFKKYNV